MGKKMYVPVFTNNKSYKLFLDDVKRVHQKPIRKTPALPSYHDGGASPSKRWDELTDF